MVQCWIKVSDTRDPEENAPSSTRCSKSSMTIAPWLFLYMQPDFYGVSNRLDWQPRRDELVTFAAKLK